MRREVSGRAASAGRIRRLPVLLLGLCGTVATAQAGGEPPAADRDSNAGEVTVTGDRRSLAAGIQAVATFDANAIAATGATTIAELLRVIRAVTQAADGSDPIFLLNAQRISGYEEIATLPPEAIEKVEVLPEPVALKFGYPPTRRVLNFITKRRFRQAEVRATGGGATRGGYAIGTANFGLTRLAKDSRLTVGLEYRHAEPLRQSDRTILPDPDILFDAIGNVTGIGGGEIDPVLSAAAGRVVTVARAPENEADRTIAGFAAGAGQPRPFDIGRDRMLTPRNDAVKAEAVLADRVGATTDGSISLSAERSRDRNLAGPATAILTVPGGNPFSPFAGPVLLNRYLVEADPLRVVQTTTTLHAGGILRGVVAGWRWDLSGALDQQEIRGSSARGIDPAAANAAIAGGTNPFAPLDPALLTMRVIDRGRLRTRSASAKTVLTNTPIRLPAGKVTVTATGEAERATAVSSTRGADPFALRLGRTRIEGGVAVDVPIASRREDVLPFVGELSVNAAMRVRAVEGFRSLYDTTYGLTWGMVPGVQLLATQKRTTTAPAIAQLSTPQVRFANVPVFDFTTGSTVNVTLLQGGNPDLVPEHRRSRSLQLSIKPFAARELRVSTTYDATTIRNQTGMVYALTAQTAAILPDLFVRDAAGRLVSVAYSPITIARERQRILAMVVSASGLLGTPRPADGKGAAAGPGRPSFYAGMGPSIKLGDRLQIRPGTAEIDILNGGTITGGGTARVSGYVYGGVNHLGNGLTFDAWYSAASRVRSASPVADLRFAPILKLNMGATLSIHHFTPHVAWTRKLQLKLDVSNVTDARQRVRDGTGRVPNRFQPAYLDPIGRTVKMSLRKLF
ncbi:MAG TPA: hypothetical protein VF649_05770 [Sphingomonas sp.]|jgi:hypothetical protein|uniref:hypothetical protein n=1 Tax=Sphingomonas sp. TaxID=28214 RepID=UPI002ED78771